MYRGVTWRMVLCLAAMLSCASPARADYEAGQTAWQAGRHTEALAQWREAARAGDGMAMLALGRAFTKGLGVPQDFILAHTWFNLAAGRGSAEAARERDTLAANMIPAHIALAQERARAWLSGRRADAPRAASTPRAAAPSAPAGPPAPPRAIREAQGLMAALGYKPGPADGRWGSGTAKAYAAFLRDAGMRPEEVLTPAALRAMRGIAKERKPAITNVTGSTATTSTSKESTAKTQHTKKVARSARSAVPFLACDDWYGPAFFRDAPLETVKKCLRSGFDTKSVFLFGKTPLHVAARLTGNPAIITALLMAGADAKARDKYGDTPLHGAAGNTSPAVAARLLKAGADPLASNQWGVKPLDLAVGGNRAVAAILVEAISDPTTRIRWDISTLHVAALGEQTAVVSSLLKSGANPNWRYTDGSTPLHWAAANNQTPSIVTALLKAGANLGADRKQVGTPLHWAAMNENPAIATALLNAGADPKARTKSSTTPLHWAATNENPAIAAALLKAGADPNASSNSNTTPLHAAAKSNPRLAVALALIRAGANVKARNRQGDTPLHLAASFNRNPAIVAALLKAGADPNAKGEYGKPPLESAARFQNNPAVFAMLLRAGANPKSRSGSGYTALHEAATSLSNPEVISVLIEGGADPNARKEDDSTPLHGAAQSNRNPAVVAALIRGGADPKALNKYGKSPLGYTQKNKNPAVAGLLRTGVVPGTQAHSRATREKYASETRDASAPAAASAPAGPPPPRAIREAQALMAALGYKPGPADGRWGPRTGRAYAAFLRDRRMPQSNMLTPDALRAMRTAAKGRNVVAQTTQRKAARPPANLHRLVAAGDVNGLKAALAKGVDANARDAKGWTALMRAADKGYALTVPPLLKAGADPNLRLADGATALFIAALHGHSEIAANLVDAGASVRLKGPKGQTAVDVMKAKYGGYYQARDRAADPSVLSILRAGITAADLVYFIKKKFDECGTYKTAWYGGTSYLRHSVELESDSKIKLTTHVTNLAHQKMEQPWERIDLKATAIRSIRSIGVTRENRLVIYYVDRQGYETIRLRFCNDESDPEIALEIARALTNCYDDKRDGCRKDAKPSEKYWMTSFRPVQ